MKNYILYTLWLTLFILIILLIMYYIPPITIYGYTLRKVDMLSDIRADKPEEEFPDSVYIPLLPIIKPAFIDTCRTGLTCIEDYSDSTLRGMTPFYEILDKIDTLDRPVRIAVFGDSFIEADIFTADLRELLQQKYGGCGVGYVDITSGTYGFRPTVRHSFRGWRSHAATDSAYFERGKQGISSRYFIPSTGAYVELRGQAKYASLLDTCEQSTIYFTNNGPLTLGVRINKEPEQITNFSAAGGLQQISVEGRIGSVRWTVKELESALFYGVAMDGKRGMVVDNFSLRGSTGLNLRYIPANKLKEFNRLRTYDLIILQYGLNVATPRGSDYNYYKKGVISSIEHLKECFPEAGILLLSVGDRNQRLADGEIKTMLGVKNLIRYQQNIAAESGIAFWNMFEAMGGEGSMKKLVDAKPQMANYDYTHINFKGGRYLAELLYETLVYGKKQFDRRREYEQE
ncbi:MAG: SGNH/GDSL hydrolase family protein [Bacteroides sp.]|nr:SGNH/GDSL hydrolase family protein [Bacteroides sp.]